LNPKSLIAQNGDAAFRLHGAVGWNEKAHRSLDLAGLESDVIAVPSGGDKAAIFWRCSPAATTLHAWFSRIASATVTRQQAWHGMSITYCTNFRTSGTRRDCCRL